MNRFRFGMPLTVLCLASTACSSPNSPDVVDVAQDAPAPIDVASEASVDASVDEAADGAGDAPIAVDGESDAETPDAVDATDPDVLVRDDALVGAWNNVRNPGGDTLTTTYTFNADNTVQYDFDGIYIPGTGESMAGCHVVTRKSGTWSAIGGNLTINYTSGTRTRTGCSVDTLNGTDTPPLTAETGMYTISGTVLTFRFFMYNRL